MSCSLNPKTRIDLEQKQTKETEENSSLTLPARDVSEFPSVNRSCPQLTTRSGCERILFSVFDRMNIYWDQHPFKPFTQNS